MATNAKYQCNDIDIPLAPIKTVEWITPNDYFAEANENSFSHNVTFSEILVYIYIYTFHRATFSPHEEIQFNCALACEVSTVSIFD